MRSSWLLYCLLAYRYWGIHGLDTTYTVEWKDVLHAKCVVRVNNRKEYEIERIVTANKAYDMDLGEKFSLKENDRLYAVDEQIISTTYTIDSILQAKEGSTATIPLYDRDILRGFARIEILAPHHVHFIPADPHRQRKLLMKEEKEPQEQEKQRVSIEEEAKEATRRQQRIQQESARQKEEEKRREAERIAREKQQEAVRKAQDERDRLARAEKAKQDAAARKVREEAEYLETNGLTSTKHVPTRRRNGDEFKYEVRIEFDDKPTGINWDMSSTDDQTIVESIDPHSPAAKLHLIEPRDVLLSVNGVDVSNARPMETAVVFRKAKLPRLLIFKSPAKKRKDESADAQPIVQYSLDCIHPILIANVSFPVDLAGWSDAPDAIASCTRTWLQLSEPLSACDAILYDRSDAALNSLWPSSDALQTMLLSYRGQCTFPDKARSVQAAGAVSLVIVNNVEGEAKFPDTGDTIIQRVSIPVAMIEKGYGDMLMALLELEPAICTLKTLGTPPCLYSHQVRQSIAALWKPHEPHLIPNADMPGSSKLLVWKMILPADNQQQYIAVDYLPATFGKDLGGATAWPPHRVMVSYPFFTACAKEGVQVNVKNAVLVVGRGECSFTDKARIAQQIGAVGLIVVNTDDAPIPLMFTPGEEEGLTKLWIVSIGQADGDRIEKVIESNGKRATYVKLS